MHLRFRAVLPPPPPRPPPPPCHLRWCIATTGATLWYLQSSGKIDLRPHLEKMDKIKVKADGEGEHYFIPLPLVIPLVTWTVAVLWTTTRVSCCPTPRPICASEGWQRVRLGVGCSLHVPRIAPFGHSLMLDAVGVLVGVSGSLFSSGWVGLLPLAARLRVQKLLPLGDLHAVRPAVWAQRGPRATQGDGKIARPHRL